MKLKEMKGNVAIHFNDRSQLKILKDNGFLDDGFHIAGNATWLRFKDGICAGWMPERSDFGKATKKCYEEEGITCMEFSDLIIPELTAAEVLRTIQEICESNFTCKKCPISIEDTCVLRKTKFDTNNVIEICAKWKSDHEKKEPEIETVDICRIIEIQPDGRKRCVYEEDIKSELSFGGDKRQKVEAILKNYCMEHEGEFIAVHEVVSRVKR